MDPKTLKHLSADEIKNLEACISKQYPTPWSTRGRQSNNNKTNNNNCDNYLNSDYKNHQNLKLIIIDQLAFLNNLNEFIILNR